MKNLVGKEFSKNIFKMVEVYYTFRIIKTLFV